MDNLTSTTSVTFVNGSQLENVSSSLSCNWQEQTPLETNSEQDPTMFFEIVMYPILLVICTVGNGLNLLVLLTDHEKSTTTVYMVCLAISDVILLWMHSIIYIPQVDPKFLEDSHNLTAFVNFLGMQQWIAETCVQFSDWTLILFSIERFLVISNPLKVRSWIRVRNAVAIELLALILAAISTLENAITHYVMLINDDKVSTKSQIIGPALNNWNRLQNRAEVAITIAKWIVIVLINISLIIILSKRDQFQPSGSNSSNLRNNNGILLACICLYSITQLPNVIFKCLLIANEPPNCSFNFTVKAQHIIRPFIYILFLMNYSMNFFLYCGVCWRFRKQLRVLSRSLSCSSLSTRSVDTRYKDSSAGTLFREEMQPTLKTGRCTSNCTVLSLMNQEKSDVAANVYIPVKSVYNKKLVEADLSLSKSYVNSGSPGYEDTHV